MNTLEQFIAYASDFEKTFADDNWSRLHQYFHSDAIYEVCGGSMACKLQGPDAIFAGIKKSLDGLDRRFTNRKIQPGNDLKSDENTVSLSWTASYELDGQPPFVLAGRSEARLHDGKISLLRDSYDPQVEKDFSAWMETTGIQLEPGYV
ncbi:MAG: nuclear transport factor 2 family protein [Gammaproteobacteria bacterium]|nr:nuclear transport factor 2 family protein [Gammaproteobacteria bacterium]NND39533.1 nuclear transport factor 2 family protein [Pseudomonadales bacterium]MBT8151140.1 nuclear transport factor 2 family protein [Gammaproteobacteria bacterium]NNL10314.1 nuclear transport factor 2 family protein [Pseudomonadales bacterium]NNM11852.1 nuclear transport factor 2 family protein [Pseudomonadales bacterium]